jgi:hypothetical protein
MSESTPPRQGLSLLSQSGPILSRIHRSMTALSLLGALIAHQTLGAESVLPFLCASALMWVNLIVMIKGLQAVLEGRSKVIGLAMIKLPLLFGGIYGLGKLFTDQQLPLLIGCSTWLIALFWSTQIVVNPPIDSDKLG